MLIRIRNLKKYPNVINVVYLIGNKCHTVLTVPSGTIRSSNYPNPYTSSSVCLWTIMGREGTNILLEVILKKLSYVFYILIRKILFEK